MHIICFGCTILNIARRLPSHSLLVVVHLRHRTSLYDSFITFWNSFVEALKDCCGYFSSVSRTIRTGVRKTRATSRLIRRDLKRSKQFVHTASRAALITTQQKGYAAADLAYEKSQRARQKLRCADAQDLAPAHNCKIHGLCRSFSHVPLRKECS